MLPLRLILDPPAKGSWNMAVDQVLLESAEQSGQTTVRFYSWSEPTLSLGYFQHHEDRAKHEASRDCRMVRRSTGGGAILHDHEITYSLAVPSNNRWSTAHEELYWTVHRTIIDLLNEQGIPAELSPALDSSEDTAKRSPADAHDVRNDDQGSILGGNYLVPSIDPKSFLCFQRRTPGDVTLHGFKICGSAQRRKKNALLQHGSLLLRKSNLAHELLGIEELSGGLAGGSDSLLTDWLARLKQSLNFEWLLQGLTADEITRAKELENTVYSSFLWNRRR